MRASRRLHLAVPAFIASVCLACGVAAATNSSKTSNLSKAPADPTVDAARYAWERDVRVVEYTAAANANQAKAWYEWAAAEDARRAQEAAEARAAASRSKTAAARVAVPRTQSAAPPAQPRTAPSSGVSGACGGATNGADRFIGAESGGNPNARNPSGAWGCYQIMPGTWKSSCSDLGQHGTAGTDAQAQCASRLPSSSWAATGG